VREIVYRLEPPQVTKMRRLALGFLAVTAGLIVASATVGGPWWLVAVFTAIFAVAFGLNWWGQRGVCTRLDDWGIRARIFSGSYREAAWSEIEEVSIRARSDRDRAVLIVLRSGTQFSPAAPVDTAMFPDPAFDRKFADIHDAWEYADRER
jgi:hypothetical protein